MLEVGSKVTYMDDNDELIEGVVEQIFPGNGACATHYGNLYVCRFPLYDDVTYTQNFDDRSIGQLQLVG